MADVKVISRYAIKETSFHFIDASQILLACLGFQIRINDLILQDERSDDSFYTNLNTKGRTAELVILITAWSTHLTLMMVTERGRLDIYE